MEPNLNLPLRLKLRLVPGKQDYALGLQVMIYDETSGAVLDTCDEWSIEGKPLDGFVALRLRCLAAVDVQITGPHSVREKAHIAVDGKPYELTEVTPVGGSSVSVGFKPVDGKPVDERTPVARTARNELAEALRVLADKRKESDAV